MRDFLIFFAIITGAAWAAIAAGYIWARGRTVRNIIKAPFIAAGIILSIILPFIGGALLSLLHYSKKYK